jgi:peptidoglycan biosynthesis protein MviN/MurJ (putative lipid II flippase)
LAVLWIAVIGQLVGALGAAVLGVRGEFGVPGIAYVLGALGSLAALLVLPASVGVLALAFGIAMGSLIMAAVILARLIRLGYRPRLARFFKGVLEVRAVALLLVASIPPAAWQLNYLISLAYAARLGAGAVTLYTYAYSAAGVVTGVTASAGSVVLAGQISRRWDRRPQSLEPYLRRMVRAGLMITLPSLACAAWIGEQAIMLLLGPSLTQSDAHTIVGMFLGLGGMLIGTMAVQVPLIAAFTVVRYGRVAILLLLTCGFHLAITASAYMTGELVLLGVAASISALVALLLVIALMYGHCSGRRLMGCTPGDRRRGPIRSRAAYLAARTL